MKLQHLKACHFFKHLKLEDLWQKQSLWSLNGSHSQLPLQSLDALNLYTTQTFLILLCQFLQFYAQLSIVFKLAFRTFYLTQQFCRNPTLHAFSIIRMLTILSIIINVSWKYLKGWNSYEFEFNKSVWQYLMIPPFHMSLLMHSLDNF